MTQKTSVTVNKNLPVDFAKLCKDYNLIHTDPEFARKVGLRNNILQGLCILCLCAKHVVGDADPGKLKSMSVRFILPVFPEDILTIQSVGEGDDDNIIMTNQNGKIVLKGKVAYR